jgi:hypothetical protein
VTLVTANVVVFLDGPRRREAAVRHVSSIADGTGTDSFCSTLSHARISLYIYDAKDRLIAPPMVISADNDDAATKQAETMLDGFAPT